MGLSASLPVEPLLAEHVPAPIVSGTAASVAEAVQRLNRRDPSLNLINLTAKRHTDAELAELLDCLWAYPDFVTRLYLGDNRLTDETGVKLAQYIAASSTFKILALSENRIGEATYLAMAAALRVNTSLQLLCMQNNQAADRARIDAAFVEALRLNPHRPVGSGWHFYSSSEDLGRLTPVAHQLGHPSLQLLLTLLC